MSQRSYANPPGGLPLQGTALTGRAVFTEAYALIPAGVMRDIVTSALPGWRGARAWVLARPLSGFAETFAQMIVELAPGGGADAPEPEAGAEAVLFVTGGVLSLSLAGASHEMHPGGYAYIPPGASWRVANGDDTPAVFHWIRKAYTPVPGVAAPAAFVTSDSEVAPEPMPGTDGVWATSRFVDPGDIAHDMHVNIVTFQPGGEITFEETHVMEHGLYVLEGSARYLLNRDWHEVGPGDFIWLRAFCPQACVATGEGPFRYLLYKDVNRLPPLSPP